VIASRNPALDREAPPSRRTTIDREAECRLRRSGYLALRDVSCDVRAGVVRLRGRLPTYYLKQVAQAVVAEVEGVRRIINLIDVVASAGRPGIGCERGVAATDPPRPDGTP
jgi:hypothetical protein